MNSKSIIHQRLAYIDSTDPNETGRNTAQIIFEQEKEDKKTLGKY